MSKMKQFGKRGLSMILALVMCLSLLPVNVLAAEALPAEEPPKQEETQAQTPDHVHNQDGWVCQETRTWSCGKEEHTHTDACYKTTDALTCELGETEGHKHNDDCYDADEVPTCALEETEGHTHTEDCYETKQELGCEVEQHTHGDECVETVKYTCTAPSEAVAAFLNAVKAMREAKLALAEAGIAPIEGETGTEPDPDAGAPLAEAQAKYEAAVQSARTAYDALSEEDQANPAVAGALSELEEAEKALKETGGEDPKDPEKDPDEAEEPSDNPPDTEKILTVIFLDANGGAIEIPLQGGGTATAQYLRTGDTLVYPAAPVKGDGEDGRHYVFEGWYHDGAPFQGVGEVIESGIVTLSPHYGQYWHVSFLNGDGSVCYVAQVEAVNGTLTEDDITAATKAYVPNTVGSTVASWSMAAGAKPDGNVKVIATEKAGVWVKYDSQGGPVVNDMQPDKEGKVNPPTIFRAGYDFTGWYTDADCTAKFDAGTAITETTTLYAGWTPKMVPYTVIYWAENPNWENPYLPEAERDHVQYSCIGTVQGEALAGATITPDASRHPGQGFQDARVDTAVVAGDGSTIANVYYDREEYEVTWAEYTAKVLTCVREEHEHQYSKREWRWTGYTYFGGCYPNSGGKNPICGKEAHTHNDYNCYKTQKMPAKTITAKYGATINSEWPEGSWKVESTGKRQLNVYEMPLGGESYSSHESQTGATAYYYKEKLGSKGEYELDHTDKANGGAVTSDDRYPIPGFTLNNDKSTGNGSKYNNAKFYYDRNDYTITFIASTVSGNATHVVTVPYEGDIASYVNSYVPNVNDGTNKVFDCWCLDEAGKNPAADTLTGPMPARNITVYAKWKSTTYTVTVIDGDKTESFTVEVPAGQDSVTLDMSSIAAKAGVDLNGLRGFTFNGSILQGSIAIGSDITLATVRPGQGYGVHYDDPDVMDENTYTLGNYAVVKEGKNKTGENGETLQFDHWEVTDTEGNVTKYYPGSLVYVGYGVTLKPAYVNPSIGVAKVTYHDGETTNTDTVMQVNGWTKVGGAITSKPGYAFMGWAESAGADTAAYQPGDWVFVGKNGIDLYAVWVKNDYKVTVKYLEQGTNKALAGEKELTNKAYGETVAENAMDIPGYKADAQSKQVVVSDTLAYNVITFYYTKRTDLSYVVKYLDENGNALVDQKTVENKTFGETCEEIAETVDGYTVDEQTKSVTMTTGTNEIVFHYTKRTDLSYVVNYLEKDTNAVLAKAKTVDGQTFKAEVTEQPVSVTGYDAPEAQTIIIEVENNVINFYYTKRTDLSYTVNYLDKAGNPIHEPDVVKNQTFEDVITAESVKIAIDGYTCIGADKDELVIGVDEEANVINLTYAVDRIGVNDPDAGDGIPDEYQITVTFNVNNGYVAGNSRVVLTKVDGSNNPSANGVAELNTIPSFVPNENYDDGRWIGRAAVLGTKLSSDTSYTYGFVYQDPNPNPSEVVIEDPDVPQGDIDIDDNEIPLASANGLNDVDHFAYILGYEDDTVRPLENITRAEVATIYFRLMTDVFRILNWSTTNDYSDVNEGDWHNNAISTATAAGIIFGYDDGTYRPNQFITRAEFAAFAANLLDSEEFTGETVEDFADTVGHWAAEAIRRAVEGGWITGGEDGLFRPDDYITRAEAITIFNRMLHRVPDEEHMLPEMKQWIDNPKGTWYYEAVQEASNEHDYERDEDEVESWTGLLPDHDWKKLEEEWAAENAAPDGDNQDSEA